MKGVQYGVVILNYNSYEDTLGAASSVIDKATSKSFEICIVDGGSTRLGEFQRLKELNLPNTFVVSTGENRGYAYGNNFGIRYLIEKCEAQYIVVMNPDVRVESAGLVESLINTVEHSSREIVGAQPIVWTKWKKEPKNEQISIRNTYRYSDILIESNALLKRVFKRRYDQQVFKNRIPYEKKIDFTVPSGAFFLIDRVFFESIGMFDERTFLYTEEIILGKKIEDKHKKLRFDPHMYVTHESGKTIGSNAKHVSLFAFRESEKSLDVYLKYYLAVGIPKRVLVKTLSYLNFSIKQIVYLYRKIRNEELK
ncbi:glycosyltransferase [Lacticaseibacillus suihuaensis]